MLDCWHLRRRKEEIRFIGLTRSSIYWMDWFLGKSCCGRAQQHCARRITLSTPPSVIPEARHQEKSHFEILRRLHELNHVLFFWQIGAGSGSNYVERGDPADANFTASSVEYPLNFAWTNPAVKLSPPPVVSTTFTLYEGTRNISSPSATSDPFTS